jgi:hypothetical protein
MTLQSYDITIGTFLSIGADEWFSKELAILASKFPK